MKYLRFPLLIALLLPLVLVSCGDPNNGNPPPPEAPPPLDVFKRQISGLLDDIESIADVSGPAELASASEALEEGMGSIDVPAGGSNANEVQAVMDDVSKVLRRADSMSKKEIYDELDSIRSKLDSL